MATTSTEPAKTAHPPGEHAPARPRSGIFEVLAQPNFRWYWFGLLGMTFALDILRFSFPWLAYYLTGSTIAVGLMSFAFGVPNLVLTPFGGVLADRVGRGPIIRATQVLSVVLSIMLAATLLLGVTAIWVVAILAAVIGAVHAFDQPARQALVPALVPRAVLFNAMALTSSAWSLARIVGPAVAGVLLAFFLTNGIGPGGIFLVAAVGFTIMFVCMLRVNVPRFTGRAQPQSVVRDLAEGFRYVSSHPIVLALFLVVGAGSTFGLSFTVLLPVVALEVYGVDERGLGLLVASTGLGGLLGTASLAMFASYLPRRGLLLIGGSSGFGILLLLFSQSTSMLLSLPLLVLVGIVQSWYQTSAHTILQMLVPDAIRGRVMANYSLTWSFISVGGALMGVLAALLSAPIAIGVGGAILLACSLACAVLIPEVRRLK